MILYLDTSALVKLYVEEEGCAAVRKAASDAEITATCEIAYLEACSALARMNREHVLSAAAYRRTLRDLRAEWPRFFSLAVVWPLMEHAGAIAERYRLRAYDALHLAAALRLKLGSQEQVTFACWERHLNRAAVASSLALLVRAT